MHTQKKVSQTFKICLLLAQITVGGLLTIIYKSQNSIYVYEGPIYKQNFHPYIQTLTMFIGELFCLPIHYVLRRMRPQQYKAKQLQAVADGKQLGMNKLYLLIPALCDLITSTLHFIALNFVPASAYNIINGGNIVTCFLLSVILLKQPLHRSQLFGCFLLIIGVLIVGIVNIVEAQEKQTNTSTTLEVTGYFLLVISLFTSGLFFTSEQKLMSKYYLEPLEIVGYEGVFGLIIYTIIVTILCFVPCDFGPEACVYTREGWSYMEGLTSYFDQIFQHKLLLFLTFCWIFSVTAYNPLGVSVTKHINALARAISDVSQIVLVWGIGIVVTLTLGQTYPNLAWEKLEAFIIVIQLIGFIFLVSGNLIYNDIVTFPCLKVQPKQQLVEQNVVTSWNTHHLLGTQQKIE